MAEKKPRVGVDVDGVLADLLTPMVQTLDTLFGIKIENDHVKEYDFNKLVPEGKADQFWAFIAAEGFHDILKPYPGAEEGILALQEVADVHIVTSPLWSSKTWVWERNQWLYRHFKITQKKIHHTHAKEAFFGKMLVDDKPQAIEDWRVEHPNGIAVLWSQPYNAHCTDMLRLNAWPEVVRLVKML